MATNGPAENIEREILLTLRGHEKGFEISLGWVAGLLARLRPNAAQPVPVADQVPDALNPMVAEIIVGLINEGSIQVNGLAAEKVPLKSRGVNPLNPRLDHLREWLLGGGSLHAVVSLVGLRRLDLLTRP